MTTPESYRPAEEGSSPAPPALDKRPRKRFQFRLLELLAYMTTSAIVAMGLRQLLWFRGKLASDDYSQIIQVMVMGLAIGGVLYLVLRVPFLIMYLGYSGRRWREIQQHRRELDAWGEERKRKARTAADVSTTKSNPPPAA